MSPEARGVEPDAFSLLGGPFCGQVVSGLAGRPRYYQTDPLRKTVHTYERRLDQASGRLQFVFAGSGPAAGPAGSGPQ